MACTSFTIAKPEGREKLVTFHEVGASHCIILTRDTRRYFVEQGNVLNRDFGETNFCGI